VRDFQDWVRLDLDYIDRWSLALDFKILLRTIPAVILRLGAVLYIEQRISDSTVVQS